MLTMHDARKLYSEDLDAKIADASTTDEDRDILLSVRAERIARGVARNVAIDDLWTRYGVDAEDYRAKKNLNIYGKRVSTYQIFTSVIEYGVKRLGNKPRGNRDFDTNHTSAEAALLAALDAGFIAVADITG